MNESITFNSFTCNKFCRLCLTTSKTLIPMSDDHLNLYRNIIEEVPADYDMKTCTNCLWMLRKFQKFKNQCQLANNLLTDVIMDTKNLNYIQKLTNSHSLTKSRIEINDYKPIAFSNDTSHYNILQNCVNYDDSLVDLTDDYHNKSESYTDDYHNKSENFTDGYQNKTNYYHDNSVNVANDYHNKSKSFMLDYHNKSEKFADQNKTNDYHDNSVNVTHDYHNKSKSFIVEYHNKTEKIADQNKTNNYHDNSGNVTNDYHNKSEHFTDYHEKSVNVTNEYDKCLPVTNDDENKVVNGNNYNSEINGQHNDRIIILTDTNDIYERLVYSTYKTVTQKSDKFDDNTIIVDAYENDVQENDDVDNEDEMPLVLLRKDVKRNKKKKKKKIMDEELNENSTLTDESNKNEQTESKGKPKKSKKVLRDGFTSRMVQETDEYTVIKLTKEQVLTEMSDRAKTDSYIRSPFKCEQCVKAFNFDDVLQTHLEKHSVKNGSFECEMCHQYCPSAVSLRGHIKSHTTRYSCKLCGCVRLSRQHLLEHHATHSGATAAYTCDRCRFTTDKRTVMQRHVRSHRSLEPLPCHTCGKLFKTIESLRLHTARHDKSSRFKCDRCDKAFVYHSLLRRHIQCVHERREFYCVECDVQFKCSESLRLHFKKTKKHRDSSAFKHKCTECNACFASLASLSTHRSAAHAAPRQHPCPHCRRMYSTRDAARAHAWRVHSRGDTRASCAHCGNSYARKSTLKLHLLTHTGARPHTCECGAAFTQQKTLQTHVQVKHKKEELQQYENKIEV